MSKGKTTCKPSGGKSVSTPRPIATGGGPRKPKTSVAMTGGGPRKKGYA